MNWTGNVQIYARPLFKLCSAAVFSRSSTASFAPRYAKRVEKSARSTAINTARIVQSLVFIVQNNAGRWPRKIKTSDSIWGFFVINKINEVFIIIINYVQNSKNNYLSIACHLWFTFQQQIAKDLQLEQHVTLMNKKNRHINALVN
ncbi:MAG TPA: hypothetical protein VEY51_15280 [Chondromyces sp.]|nr:hypothetical protein [Chondromyces sp.]